jgi:hypothetical protein
MNNEKMFTVNQIRSRFNKEKPRYIGLKNQSGQWPVPINSPSIKAEQRMKQIENFFSKDSTPDGIYFFIQKDSLTPNSPEIVTQVGKGDTRNLPALTEQPRQTLQVTPTKDVWDLKTALDKETQIISLTLQLQFIQDQNIELRRRIKELEEQRPLQDDEEKKSDGKAMMEGLKEIIEIATPVIDKYFDHDDRKLKLREAQLNGSSPSGRRETRLLTQSASQRTDGGVPVDDPGYEEYFKVVVEQGTDPQFDHECNYLESVNPALYQILMDKYNPVEEETNGE